MVLGLRYGGSIVARLGGNAHLAGSWTTGSTQWRGEAGDRRGRAVQNCYAEGVDRGAGVRQGFRSGSGVSSSCWAPGLLLGAVLLLSLPFLCFFFSLAAAAGKGKNSPRGSRVLGTADWGFKGAPGLGLVLHGGTDAEG